MAKTNPIKTFFKTNLGMAGNSPEPMSPYQYDASRSVILPRQDSIPLSELYYLAAHCNPVYKSLQTIRDYLFKEGYKWVKRYSVKCLDCGQEHPTSHEPQSCESCGSTNLHEPSESMMREVDDFFQSCDLNDNSFIELCKMYEFHSGIANSSYMVVAKEYKEFDETGLPKRWKTKNIFIPHPMNFYKVTDVRTQQMGGKFWVCISRKQVGTSINGQPIYEECRPGTFYDRDGNVQRSGQVYTHPGNCDACGGKLFDVWYIATKNSMPISADAPGGDDIVQYYLGPIRLSDGTVLREVITSNKYLADYGYGQSPMVSIYKLAITLLSMENYNYTFYHEARAPRILLSAQTNNPDGIRNVWQDVQDKNVGQGGHHIPLITFDPGNSSASRPLQVLELSKTPAELAMLDTNKWFYTCIGSAFGVQALFLGINTNSGMQSQGPTQWQVQRLTAEVGQNLYNLKVFPQLLEQFGLHKEGWKLTLAKPEENIDGQIVELRLLKQQEAIGLLSMGFEVTARDSNGDYKFSSRPNNPMAGQDQSAMGGAPMQAGGGMGNAGGAAYGAMGGMGLPMAGGVQEGAGAPVYDDGMMQPGMTPQGPGKSAFEVNSVE